jgi:hypothetical protein
LQPSLNLLTKDGALLSEDDPVLLVVGSEEVMSAVTSWNIPQLTDRYIESCHALHSGIIAALITTQLLSSPIEEKLKFHGTVIGEI